MDYVAHLVELANISDYHPCQVDVAHRTSTKPVSFDISFKIWETETPVVL